jgi:hypothetical protein
VAGIDLEYWNLTRRQFVEFVRIPDATRQAPEGFARSTTGFEASLIVAAVVHGDRESVVAAKAVLEGGGINGSGLGLLRLREDCAKDWTRQSDCKYKYYGKFGRFSHECSPRFEDSNIIRRGQRLVG